MEKQIREIVELPIRARQSKKKVICITPNDNKRDTKGLMKDVWPRTKEWSASVYNYNKEGQKGIGNRQQAAIRLVKGYLNLYSKKQDLKMNFYRSRRYRARTRKHSVNRILTGRVESKQTNDAVKLTVYLYNTKENSYKNMIRKIIGSSELEKPNIESNRYNSFNISRLAGKIGKFIHKRMLKVDDLYANAIDMGRLKFDFEREKWNYIMETFVNRRLGRRVMIRFYKLYLLTRIMKKTDNLTISKAKEKIRKTIEEIEKEEEKKEKEEKIEGKEEEKKEKGDKIEGKLKEENEQEKEKNKEMMIELWYKKYHRKWMKLVLKREFTSIYYKQLMSVNKMKFHQHYMTSLQKEARKIFNKAIEFNFVNLKYLHMDSNLISRGLTTKLRKKRTSVYYRLKGLFERYRVPVIDVERYYKERYSRSHISDNPSLIKLEGDKDIIDVSIDRYIPDFANMFKLSNIKGYSQNTSHYLDTLRYKLVKGIRVELAGRLTKRYKAARSVFKLRYRGNIRNELSSRQFSTAIMLRGSEESNVQYHYTRTKRRIGVFGTKVWVSSG